MLNVTYPLVPEEIAAFCVGKRAVLVVEEGAPDYIEQAINAELRRADIQTRIHGKDVLPMAGEYTAEVVLRGLANFLAAAKPAGIDAAAISAKADRLLGHKRRGRSRRVGDAAAAPADLLHRLPGAAGVLRAQARAARDRPDAHLGRHRLPPFATFAPFSMGNSILGYGMSLASRGRGRADHASAARSR